MEGKKALFSHPADATLDEMVGTLPDLFRFTDGRKVVDRSDWDQRRQELLEQVVSIAYGGLPPMPEVFQVEELSLNDIQITAGTKQATVTFELQIFKPGGEGKHPVLLTADGHDRCNDDIIRMFQEHGFIVAHFNRGALAKEYSNFERTKGLYPVYPELKFGTIAAWAWGYHRCVDALLQMGYVDPEGICVTGHSRGGKASLLAAATDERIAYVHASGSGMLGCGCFRYTQKEPLECNLKYPHSETVGNMFGQGVPYNIGYWFGEELEKYVGREEEIPFDLHSLKALVAPRGLLETGGVEDLWSNPRGSYQTFRAAREAYQFLGVPEKIASVYRDGGHDCRPEDFRTFLKFIEAMRAGKPFLQGNADSIFGGLKKIYDWR